MVQVKLEQISKRFGRVVAVKDITFTTEENELLALLGPSGCGKTTILRLIAGFERPDSGDILFDGQSVLHLPPEARDVGMVFQNYALFPHMNVAENIAYGLRFRRGIARRKRVQELLELVDLRGLESRRPDELSAGQRQRVALARALAPEPQVLLLDEPLSALDAKLRERLRLELKRLQRRLQITTIYVTHDQEEALAIADRVAVMSPGRIEQLATPQIIYNRPATEFVARFIGRGNLLAGTIVARTADRITVKLAAGEEIIVRISGSGSSISGPASENLKPGELYRPGREVWLLIRPERLRLSTKIEVEAGTEAIDENRLRGRLRDLEFLGDALLLHLDRPDSELRVKLPPDIVVHEGQELELSFRPTDCHLIVPA